MKFFHIDKLDFWSAYFWVAPVLMIVLGIYTFLICVYGFLISGSERRALIAFYAFLLSIAFLAQLISIFTALEVRTKVAQANIGLVTVNEDLNYYGVDSATTAKWDILQSDLHCCGGNNFLTGYNDYRNTPMGKNFSVPDSCCHTRTQGCGRDLFRLQEAEIRNRIFMDGCLTILKDKLENDVIPMMIVYACIGVLLAIIELVTVVLACAYVAQITRKINREDKMWRHGTADHNNDDVTDAINGETMC